MYHIIFLQEKNFNFYADSTDTTDQPSLGLGF